MLVRKDGRPAQIEYVVAPIRGDAEVSGAVLVIRDVALRRKYEEALANQHRDLERLVAERSAELKHENEIRARTETALRQSRERLKSIADSLFECVVVVNHAGHVMFVNAAAQRTLGFPGETLEGLPLDSLMRLVVDGQDVVFADSPWRRVISKSGHLRDDDATVKAMARAIPLSVAYACSAIGDKGSRRGAVISFRDIAELKAAQREAMQASRLASVGQLASGIAHEINSPVQYIGTNLQFIGDSLETMMAELREPGSTAAGKLDFLIEELPAAVRESLEGVDQISRIVLSMKEFSHPGTATKTLTDINRALETTLTVSVNVWKHVATIVRHFDPDLPSIPCHAGEINQVFLNLVVNAAEAIESSGKPRPGTIAITTRRSGQWVEIVVADSGTGISPANLERVFDPFFTTKDVGKGTGQGLAICRDVVVVKHGGKIEAGGVDGAGAVFVVRLPIDPQQVTDEADRE
jgi:PAS domain S-box-containing protein